MSGLVAVCYLPLIPPQPVNTVGGANQPMPNVPAVPAPVRRDASIDLEFIANSCIITRTVKLIAPSDPLVKAWLTVKNNAGDPDPGVLQKIITPATTLASPGRVTADGSSGGGNGTGTLVFGLVIADTQALTPNKAYVYDIQVLTAGGNLYTIEAGGGIGGAGGGFNWLPRVTGATT